METIGGLARSAPMTRAIILLSLFALAACGLPQSPGQAPTGGTYNPVSKTNNDG